MVCKLSLGSPMTRAGDSRRSLFLGINRAKTRRTGKRAESDQVWSSSSRRSRANTLLNEIRTSLPKRSTQPSSIVQSRCASVPSALKSRSKLGSIHPVIILFLCSNGIVRNQYGATDGLPGNSVLLHWRDHVRAVESTAACRRPNLCNKSPFVFPRAVPISVLATIVWASLSDFITALQSSAARAPDLLIHKLSPTRQNGFSSRRGGESSRFRVQLWNEFL